jgi:NAD(P)-dependent dehydrogenase (short-subunit alcohol dehydrogenase family)
MTDIAAGGRVAVVTGAAGGLGQVFCVALARTGVAVAGVDIADLSDTAAAVTAAGGDFLAVVADVTDPASMESAAASVANRFGRADICVNNAGIYPLIGFEETSVELWRRVMSINLDGAFYTVRAFLPLLKESAAGRIVNIASAVVWLAPPRMVAYTASKGGLIGFTRALASELGSTGITVNAITPSMIPTKTAIDTGVTGDLDRVVGGQAVPRAQQPEDLVSTLLYLCDPASDFVTGSAINVDGGNAKH